MSTADKKNPLKEHWQKYEAILFDMDGTLVDSMWMWEAIDVEYLSGFGKELPSDLQKCIEGMSFSETAVYIKNRFQIPDSTDVMKAQWNQMACEKYRHEVPYKKGAEAFLKQCREAGIRLGVATSNSRELVEVAAEALGMYNYFDEILTACEVKKGKPAPDVYLEVAKRLGVSPEKCLVFEDVLAGVQAGKNAGMTVCAVKDAHSKASEEDIRQLADYYIYDYEELL